MKNLKTIMAASLCGLFLVGGLAACGSADTSSSSQVLAAKTIGVLQYAPNPSLDNCYTGFKEGLAASGYVEGKNLTINFVNAQADATANTTAANNFVSKNVDLIGAIATPSAVAAAAAAQDSATPVVFTAVSDPVAAGLVKSLTAPGANVTGSSDVLPLDKQLKMIRAFLPDAKTIGVLYTTSEPNSISQLATLKSLAPNYGFTIVEQGVSNSTEVSAGATALAAKGVDCFNNFTDNNVVNQLPAELEAANNAKIPVFGSEQEQVKNGCIAADGIDYEALGKQTGIMAANILKGEAAPATTPVYTISDGTVTYNQTILTKFGVTLPADYASAKNMASSEPTSSAA